MKSIIELQNIIPTLDKKKHLPMLLKVHEHCKQLKDYNISVDNQLVILTPKIREDEDKIICIPQFEYCMYVLPEVLPLNQEKYGVGTILHLRSKMDEYIRGGIHPLEYIATIFNCK
jgi:hypothetical protein